MKPYKPKEYYPQKAKGIAFLAFFLSIFLYISIFYVFNLSLSTLFNNTKFWFAISNTLILIIAADYGAFSSSKNQQDNLYQEYLNHSQPRTTPSFDYPQIVDKANNEEVVVAQNGGSTIGVQDKKVVHESKGGEENHVGAKTNYKRSESEKAIHVPKGGEENHVRAKTNYKRSKSEKAKRVVIDESKNTTLTRSDSMTENYQHQRPSADQDDEFSAMSDEEVNRRVEEFIQKFNRQMRLQLAAENYHQA